MSTMLPLPTLLLVASLANPVAPPPPSHLVLVTLDTTRADALGVYGGDAATPTLDALARRGTRWQRALSDAPLTLPSHASLMTGRTPPAHGVRDNATDALAGSVPTLASELSARGFRTVAVVASRVLDRRFGLSHGFDVYDDQMPAEELGEYGYAERRADAAVDAALGHLQRQTAAPRSQRLFLWLHLYDPHAPYAPPTEAARGSSRSSAKQRYLEELEFCDRQLARLMEALPVGTLVAVVGDHGEALGEHGEDTHGIFLYEASLHVPLLLAGPGVPQNLEITEPVASRRLAHSLLRLLGLEADALPGPSLPGLRLEDPTPATMAVYSESLLPATAYGWSSLHAVSEGPYRYILAPRPELYDLRVDPTETHNLLEERPEVAVRLRRLVEEELGRAVDRQEATLDEGTRNELEALGYLSGASEAAAPDTLDAIDPKDGLTLLKLFDKAKELRGLGNLTGAIAAFDELLEKNPDNGPVRTHLAEAHLAAGHTDRALALYREAADRRPDFEFARFQLAGVLLNLGRIEEARAELERVLTIDARFADAWLSLAQLAHRRGDAAEERRVLERAVEAGTQSAAIFIRLGMKLASGPEADPSQAADLLRQATDAVPNWPLPWLIRGQILLQQGNAAEARRCLQEVVRLASPSSAEGVEARRLLAGLG